MINTIVLDFDGPLLDGKERHYRCYSKILEEHGFAPIERELYWQMKRNRVDRRKLLALSDALPLYNEFLATWIQLIETKEYLALDRLQEGALDILQTWKQMGIKLLLATMRNHPENLYWQLEQIGIKHCFDGIFPVASLSGDDGKAAAVGTALQGQDLTGVIWIGDTEVDISAAKKLGVPVCALECGLRTREYLASLSPDSIEPDLRTFAAKLQLA